MGAILFRRGRVLLVERGRAPLKGWWSLPGGVLETGETVLEGVRREVREETGLEVKPLRMVELFERILRDARGRVEYHYVLADYVCRVTGGELKAGDDVARAEWVDPRRLEEWRLTEGSLAVIRKAYADYKRRSAGV